MNSREVPITAVIPTYNRAGLLRRAIESALAQQARPAQVVVVDDGSTDETPAVCQAFEGRIEYLRQMNAGASVARNAGVARARQPWIAFLDSDDYWAPSHLARMATAIEATKGEARFYFCDMEFPREEGGGTLWGTIGFRPSGEHQLVADATPWMLLKRQPTMLQSSVFKKQALEACGGLRPQFRLMHDSDLFLRLGIGGGACAVSGVGCIQTADDTAGTRLTGVVHDRTEEYTVEQWRLWHNAFRMSGRMQPEQRRLARYNLAVSHWRLARSGWRARRLFDCGRHLVSVAWTDPEFLMWVVRHRQSDGFEARVRPACPEITTP